MPAIEAVMEPMEAIAAPVAAESKPKVRRPRKPKTEVATVPDMETEATEGESTDGPSE